MLVLFAGCWERKLSIQARVEKLNGDLHQSSRIRYVSISFSVRCLVSLGYWERLIYGIKLSIVVPASHRNFLSITFFLFEESPYLCLVPPFRRESISLNFSSFLKRFYIFDMFLLSQDTPYLWIVHHVWEGSISSLLLLVREVFSNYTKLVMEVFKLHSR